MFPGNGAVSLVLHLGRVVVHTRVNMHLLILNSSRLLVHHGCLRLLLLLSECESPLLLQLLEKGVVHGRDSWDLFRLSLLPLLPLSDLVIGFDDLLGGDPLLFIQAV